MRKHSAGESRKHWSSLNVAPALRIVFTALLVLLQVATCWAFVRYLQDYAVTVYVTLELIAAVVTIVLISGQRDTSYRYAWVVMVLMLGVFGLVLFLLWGRGSGRNALGRRLIASTADPLLPEDADAEAMAALAERAPHGQRMSRYLHRLGFPLYQGTDARYYPLGELAFEAMLADIAQAERAVYMEFFMVFEGAIWERFFAAMAAKAAAGVDVRLIYDDLGSITTTSHAFLQRLRDAGIRVEVFNPVHRYIYQLYLNYRDHRKILSIDCRVAYTGGINIGDEYANLYEKHGHWKDIAVRLEGPAAFSLTAFFAQMWEAVAGERIALEPVPAPLPGAAGYLQPYQDGPHNNPENPAQNVYMEMINAARSTLYITTPYLVIDDLLLEALCQSARSGVDVRIVLPHIPDHWYVMLTSRSFYGKLFEAGARIYEYTPGFIHAKSVVIDGIQAAVGTINMDFRSFNLQYECGVWFCEGAMPATVQADIEAVLKVSQEITLEAWKKRPWYIKAAQPVLKLFAPLM